MNHNAYNEFCTRKLAHYNAWLMSDKPVGTIYPGFPEEFVAPVPSANSPVHTKRAEVNVASIEDITGEKKKRAKKMPAVMPPKREKKRKAGTKQEKANAIVAELLKSNTFNSKELKAASIEKIMADCEMSFAGAQTYFYNAMKEVK